MKIETFEDIQAWKKGRELTNRIYEITRSDNFNKDRGLRDQIRRASVSIVSNIAEGFERNTDKEFKQFLFIAKGSCGEVRSQLYIAYDQGYIQEKDFTEISALCVEISKMISKFITYLHQTT
ncbi:MAG: four helix bundle protein [candidate division SR1 bacterium]|nr:four helix bundle protein [candidate division SR1 bacterium]